jgi:hypothetical protein
MWQCCGNYSNSWNHTGDGLKRGAARWFAEPISSTLKMEAISSSEKSFETQRTTRRHIPEDDTLQNHRCENVKSYVLTTACVPSTTEFSALFFLTFCFLTDLYFLFF